jgi:hypothetical protein
VSFETLEHVAAQDALVGGFARALAPGGLLLVSSPDKANYSDKSGFRNEFHVRELYRDELLELLARHFPHVRLYAQKLLFQSAIWTLDDAAGALDACVATGGAVESGMRYEPMYYIAACSDQPLPADLPQLSLFGDADESVYRHYNDEIRKNIAAGRRIAELEAQLAAASPARDAAPAAPTAAPEPLWRRWLRRRP